MATWSRSLDKGYGNVQTNPYNEEGEADITRASSPVPSSIDKEVSDDHDIRDHPDDPATSPLTLDMDDAIERVGMGRFQFQILIAAGLCFAADSMEVLLLSFLAVVLQVEWELTETEVDSIISTVFAGAMLGTLVLSPLGDTWGRQPVFTVTAAMIALFGMATAFCVDFTQLLIVRFCVGFGVGGLTVPFDTLSEVVPTSHRGKHLLLIEFFWTAGTLLVPLAAWWTLEQHSSWRLFVIVCAIPCVLSTVLGMLLVPESPRWLLTQGKHDKALAVLRQAAALNGKDPIQVFPLGTILQDSDDESHHKVGGEHGLCCDGCGQLFSHTWRGLTLLLGGVWFGLAFLYYGNIIAVSLVFSSEVEDGDGKEESYNFDYTAIVVSSSAEILGLVMVLMTVDRWGRVPSQVWTYLMGGVSCLFLGFLDYYLPQQRNVLIVFAFASRMFMMGASCTTWVSTSEVLPTEIRTTGHGFANAMGRIGGFICPFIISEGTSLRLIGVVMMVIAVATSSFCKHLPETNGKALGGAQEAIPSHDDHPPDMDTEDHDTQDIELV